MKKTIAIAISVVIAMTFITACGKTEESSGSVSTTSESAITSAHVIQEVDILENCNLSEEQMMTVIKDYYKVFEAIMNKNGDTMTFEVEEADGKVSVRAVRENEEPSVLEWDSVKRAYEFLYTQGQVDLEGNLLVTENGLMNMEE